MAVQNFERESILETTGDVQGPQRPEAAGGVGLFAQHPQQRRARLRLKLSRDGALLKQESRVADEPFILVKLQIHQFGVRQFGEVRRR